MSKGGAMVQCRKPSERLSTSAMGCSAYDDEDHSNWLANSSLLSMTCHCDNRKICRVGTSTVSNAQHYHDVRKSSIWSISPLAKPIQRVKYYKLHQDNRCPTLPVSQRDYFQLSPPSIWSTSLPPTKSNVSFMSSSR
jgi:hypothetical protein